MKNWTQRSTCALLKGSQMKCTEQSGEASLVYVKEADRISSRWLENAMGSGQSWVVTNPAFGLKPLTKEKRKENELFYLFFLKERVCYSFEP